MGWVGGGAEGAGVEHCGDEMGFGEEEECIVWDGKRADSLSSKGNTCQENHQSQPINMSIGTIIPNPIRHSFFWKKGMEGNDGNRGMTYPVPPITNDLQLLRVRVRRRDAHEPGEVAVGDLFAHLGCEVTFPNIIISLALQPYNLFH